MSYSADESRKEEWKDRTQCDSGAERLKKENRKKRKGGQKEEKISGKTVFPFTVQVVLCCICILYELITPSDPPTTNYNSYSAMCGVG